MVFITVHKVFTNPKKCGIMTILNREDNMSTDKDREFWRNQYYKRKEQRLEWKRKKYNNDGEKAREYQREYARRKREKLRLERISRGESVGRKYATKKVITPEELERRKERQRQYRIEHPQPYKPLPPLISKARNRLYAKRKEWKEL
jgi:hypothetical protein